MRFDTKRIPRKLFKNYAFLWGHYNSSTKITKCAQLIPRRHRASAIDKPVTECPQNSGRRV